MKEASKQTLASMLARNATMHTTMTTRFAKHLYIHYKNEYHQNNHYRFELFFFQEENTNQ